MDATFECFECYVDADGRVYARHGVDPVCLDPRADTPEQLMAFAKAGHLPKSILVNLLTIENRQPFLEACASIERKYTEACIAKNDPCLETGCALEGEICLQPLLAAGSDYDRLCAAEWIKLFRSPQNRVESWQN